MYKRQVLPCSVQLLIENAIKHNSVGADRPLVIRIINRITAPDSGRVMFGGREISPEDVYRIDYLPEERGPVSYTHLDVYKRQVYLYPYSTIQQKNDNITGIQVAPL